MAGYSGVIFGTQLPPYYGGSCMAVPCPSFAVGSSIPTGCTFRFSQGNYCQLAPTTTAPYYLIQSNTCTSFDSCYALLHQTSLLAPFGLTSGVYDITYPNGVFPTFCDQETDGGGWELVLKISSNAGTLWSYGSSLWTSGSPFNTKSLDETNTDALFPQYTNGNYNQVSCI